MATSAAGGTDGRRRIPEGAVPRIDCPDLAHRITEHGMFPAGFVSDEPIAPHRTNDYDAGSTFPLPVSEDPMKLDPPVGPTARDWADATLHVAKVENGEGRPPIFELRKKLIVNGETQIQFVWLNHAQLRSVGIDHGL
jgi:hypothetical protein